MGTPNVLWLVSDQQLTARQPELDQHFPVQSRLASTGTRFTRAYTVLPICSPSRASMLTGLYPHTHGLTENDGRFGGKPGLEPGEWLVNQSLLKEGYRCGWFGKWHLNNQHAAQDFGFEGFSLPGYGYPYNTCEYQEYLQRQNLPAPVATIEIPGESALQAGTNIKLCESQDWFDFESGVALLEGSPYCHEACFVVDIALRWLDKLLDDTPFFMRIDPWGPHPPYIVNQSIVDQFSGLNIELPSNFDSQLDNRPAHHVAYRDYWDR